MRRPDLALTAQPCGKISHAYDEGFVDIRKFAPEENLWCAAILCWINDLKGYRNRVCACPEKTYCVSCRRLKDVEREAVAALNVGTDQHAALIYICDLIRVDKRAIFKIAQQIVADPVTTKAPRSALLT